MPPELLIDYLGKCRAGRQVPFLVLFHCAPVLKGIKASNMITLPKGAWLQVAGYLKGTKVDWHILSSGTRADVLLLYRKEWLEKLLADSRNRAFLEERGYRVKEGDVYKRQCQNHPGHADVCGSLCGKYRRRYQSVQGTAPAEGN